MRKIHFIAIGGAAMHNLAIALKSKGYEVTGSDDEIFEPSLSRLKSQDLLPPAWGWDPSKIDNSVNAVILGMHAHKNNPELLKAMELGIKIYSYPEFLFEQVRDKTRIVIAGSHGKTTITAMIIHVLKSVGMQFDFMVGSQLEDFDTMVSLNPDSKIAIFEGDEYLSSPLDLQPKFLHYQPHIVLISGIAWDHMNVFPTFENYVYQFKKLCKVIQPGGHLAYFAGDNELQSIAESVQKKVNIHAYEALENEVIDEVTYLKATENQKFKMNIFGAHNLQNIGAAKMICSLIGVNDSEFYPAIAHFKGTAKRLQVLKNTADSVVYYDFAHSPSKVKATVNAVKEQYPSKTLISILELHTYSSLNKYFIPQYANTLNSADSAVVYYNPEVIKNKDLEMFSKSDIKKYFNNNKLFVFSDRDALEKFIKDIDLKKVVLLFMSSGNFGGLNIKEMVT